MDLTSNVVFRSLNDMTVAKKLTVVIAMLCIPLFSLTYTFASNSNESIARGELELHGIAYNAGLRTLAQKVAEHRGMSSGYLNGDASFGPKIEAKAKEIHAAIDVQSQLDMATGSDLGASGPWAEWTEQWIAYEPTSLEESAAKNFAHHTQFVDALLQLNLDVGYSSNLTLDPGADSYYLMDIVTRKMLFWTESAGILRGLSSGIAAKGAATRAQQIRMVTLMTKLDELSKAVSQSMAEAVRNNPALADLQPLADDFVAASDKFVRLVEAQIVEASQITVTSSELFGLGSQAIGAGFLLYDKTTPVLTELVEKRVAEEVWLRNIKLVFPIVFGAVSLFLVFMVVRSLSHSVGTAVRAFNRIQQGDYGSNIVVKSKDETGQLLASLAEMQSELKEQIEQDRKSNARTSRIKQALDSASAAVLLANADCEITYANNAAQRLFKELGPTLSRYLSGLDFSDLVGSALNALHPNPEQQLRYLQALIQTEKNQLKIGGITFETVCSPVMVDGAKVGIVIEWQDLTAEIKRQEAEAQRLEEERRKAAADSEMAIANGRIKEALDSVSARVMVADESGQVIYANDAAKALFGRVAGEISAALPGVDMHNLVGQPVSGFATDSASRKAELDALSSTQKSKMTLGSRSFVVTSAPVQAQGVRTGTVVEWDDQTEQLEVERQVNQIVDAAVQGDLGHRLQINQQGTFFATLADGINQLMDVNQRAVQDLSRVLGALAEGRLDQTITSDYAGVFDELKRFANGSMQQLVTVASEMSEGAEALRSLAGEISAGNTDLSNRTERQAVALTQTASTIKEFAESAQANADHAKKATELAQNAYKEAQTGHATVKDTVRAMDAIAQTSQKIGEIIGVIDEIAFQTNLLALNAAVEAARAGEQGKGFAVVASEVRNLAQRSAAAAKDIKELISDSISKVGEGAQLVEKSGDSLDQIVGAIEAVDSVVAEIASASLEQSHSVSAVRESVQDMDASTQQNAAMVEQVAASSESMDDQASGLERSIAFFKIQKATVPPADAVTSASTVIH